MQEFDAAKELLLQTVLHYSATRTRRVSAAAAALETLAVLFIAQGDAGSAGNCLDQSLAVSSILEQDRGMRQLNNVEVAKVYFLKSLLCKRLGEKASVRRPPRPGPIAVVGTPQRHSLVFSMTTRESGGACISHSGTVYRQRNMIRSSGRF